MHRSCHNYCTFTSTCTSLPGFYSIRIENSLTLYSLNSSQLFFLFLCVGFFLFLLFVSLFLCFQQHALRLMAFGQIYKVLEMEPLPSNKPSQKYPWSDKEGVYLRTYMSAQLLALVFACVYLSFIHFICQVSTFQSVSTWPWLSVCSGFQAVCIHLSLCPC